jgi:hypothetical protein
MSTQLRRVRSGFVGRLTNIYRKTEALLDTGDVELVSQNVKEVEEAFLRFSRCHYEYFNALTDPCEIEIANQYFNEQLQRKLTFIQRMKAWMKNNAVDPEDSASNVRSLSTSSVVLKRIKANKALAELELHQLKRRQEIILKEEEMKLQRQLLEAQYKLERAQLEVNIYNQDDDAENDESLPDRFVTLDEDHGEVPRDISEQY